MKSLAVALLGLSRSQILSALMLRPEAELHVRELARVSGVSVGNLQRELRALLALGLVTRREVGRQVFYTADQTCPVFQELQSLLRKTSGMADLLQAALLPLTKRIEVAFVYGSMAAGTPQSQSDVDVMVIGSVRFADVTRALHPVQIEIGRDINPTVITTSDFVTRRRARDGFVQSVSRGAKIWLIGGEDDFAELGKDRSAASA